MTGFEPAILVLQTNAFSPWLHHHKGARWELHPRPSEPQSDALTN